MCDQISLNFNKFLKMNQNKNSDLIAITNQNKNIIVIQDKKQVLTKNRSKRGSRPTETVVFHDVEKITDIEEIESEKTSKIFICALVLSIIILLSGLLFST